jgi:hypothetical protein
MQSEYVVIESFNQLFNSLDVVEEKLKKNELIVGE